MFILNHRIIGPFKLEETLEIHLVLMLCNEQGHVLLQQVAQSPIQFDLECIQGWVIHHLSGQPVPMPHYSPHRKLLPYIQFKSPLF